MPVHNDSTPPTTNADEDAYESWAYVPFAELVPVKIIAEGCKTRDDVLAAIRAHEAGRS